MAHDSCIEDIVAEAEAQRPRHMRRRTTTMSEGEQSLKSAGAGGGASDSVGWREGGVEATQSGEMRI